MRTHFFIAMCICSCLGCSHRLIPNTRKAAQLSPFGAYMELVASHGQYTGEFITYSHDTLYLLTEAEMFRLSQQEIISFDLILVDTKAKRHLVSTGIMIAPSLIGAAAHPDYSGEFLRLGAFVGLMGGLATLVEAGRKPDVLQYPEDDLQISSFLKFARFPAGFPNTLDQKSLEPIRVIAKSN